MTKHRTRTRLLHSKLIQRIIAASIGLGVTAELLNTRDIRRDEQELRKYDQRSDLYDQEYGHPITQDLVDKVYEDLFTRIEQAKAHADHDGKNIIILVGENHQARNSLLLEFMLTDIAARLKINDWLTELDTKSLKKASDPVTPILREMDEGFYRDTGVKIPGDAFQLFMKHARLCTILAAIPNQVDYNKSLAGINRNNYTHNDLLPNYFIEMIVGMDRGIIFHPGDPRFSERTTLYESSTSKQFDAAQPEFEDFMVKQIAVQAKKGHCFGLYGARHVPGLYDKLEAQGFEVFVINACDTTTNTPVDFSTAKNERDRALAKFYDPNLRSWMQVSPSDGLAMTLKASLKHRLKRRELSPLEADDLQSLIDTYVRMGARVMKEQTQQAR